MVIFLISLFTYIISVVLLLLKNNRIKKEYIKQFYKNKDLDDTAEYINYLISLNGVPIILILMPILNTGIIVFYIISEGIDIINNYKVKSIKKDLEKFKKKVS